MREERLNSKQFVYIVIIIILCGIFIIGHNFFLTKRNNVYEEMSMFLSQEPEESQTVEDEPDTSRVVGSTTTINAINDPSSKVKKVIRSYNYVGRLKIPVIKLNKEFVRFGTSGNNINYNIAIMDGSQYPDAKNSNFILAAHNGFGWNAFFNNIDKLKKGSVAYVTYSGKEYIYKLTNIYSDKKSDRQVTIRRIPKAKQLTLITCKRPDYKKYYLVLVFELVYEVNK